MHDPFHRRRNPVFQWKALQADIAKLAEELEAYQDSDMDSSSDSGGDDDDDDGDDSDAGGDTA